jgi:type IV pilus biogenesis protein CpaD/CtpE
MSPYRVKEYMWVLIIAMVIVITLLSGCSSAPRVQVQKPQYCHTSQAIAIQNGERVSSATVVECTDDQVKKLTVARAGIGSNCGYFNGWMKRGGQDVQYRAISCQLPDGSWEVLDTYGQ